MCKDIHAVHDTALSVKASFKISVYKSVKSPSSLISKIALTIILIVCHSSNNQD